MKTTILTLATVILAIAMPAQNAADFTANDCAGNNHNLFSELNSGKVIVIAWVMPCAGCLAPSQTAYEIVQSYATSNPGQVLMYVVDDYGNSSCNTINNWVNNNGMPGVTTFSDASITMSAYGGVGMPKIIVVGGGYSHGLYFNANNSAANDSAGIQAAIDSALVDVTTVPQLNDNISTIALSPNPASHQTLIGLTAKQSATVTIDLYNALGEKVECIYTGLLQPGENQFGLSIENLAEGIYWIRITDGEFSSEKMLSVTR